MTPLTAAVVGTGFIGPVHVEAVRRLGHRVAGVLGSTPDRGRAAADRLGLGRSYDTLDQLLADPAVQVVHVTSPNRHHFDHARRCLAAGKHVVCEKPLAMTAAESAELVRLAVATPVVAAVCYNVRFYPLCHEARARLRDLGPVYHVTGSYLQDWLLYDTDFNWRVEADAGGELRAVADIGTHWLDLVTWITGLEVEEVCADLRTVHSTRRRRAGVSSVETFQAGREATRERVPRRPEFESVPVTTDDYGSLLLHFRGGAAGAVTVSQVTAGRKNAVQFQIAAAGGSLAWDSEHPEVLTIGRRDRPNERLTRDPALLSADARRVADYPGGHVEGFPDTFKQLFRSVYGHITAGDMAAPRPFPTFVDGHREAVLCEAVLASHRERRWVSL
ncbi:MAG TPA: Gfo/Idh/MocA family oxidoreductase [Gemmataceae bacterium]|jgi:predicted dehydrogenase